MELGVYLRSKDVDYKVGTGTELLVHCFWCPDGDPKGKGKLYINTETWLFNCKRCDVSGNKKKLYEYFGDVDDGYNPATDPALKAAFLNEYVTHASELLFNNDAMLLYLLRRGLTEETIIEARLGYVPLNYGISQSLPSQHSKEIQQNTGLVLSSREFLQQRITIPYVISDSVSQVRGKDPNGKYVTPPGQKVRLYNVDALRSAEKVIITEGEFDCLILQQHLRESNSSVLQNVAVVGVAGANALPEDFENYFPNIKRIFIGFDNDTVGRKASEKVSALLGQRCRTIHLPELGGSTPNKDWTDLFVNNGYTAADVARLVTEAEMRGKRVLSVSEAGVRWHENLTLSPGIQTGFPQLDSVIHPGIRAGNVVVALAKTGTGKTVLLANWAYNMRQRRVLFVTLEMMADEIYGILRKITRFHHPTFSDEQIAEAMPYLRIVDENKLTPQDFALLVEEYTEDVGQPPEVVFIDYLGYYARGMRGGSPYEKTSNAVMQLKEEAKRHELAVIAPHQVNRTAREGKPIEADEARDSGVVEETADFVFSLFRPSNAVEVASTNPGVVEGGMQLAVLKSRRGGRGKTVDLTFSAMSLAIVDSLQQQETMKVREENAAYNAGRRYEDVYQDQYEQAYERAQLRLAHNNAPHLRLVTS